MDIQEKLKLKLQFLLKNQMEIMENQKITTMMKAKTNKTKRLIQKKKSKKTTRRI